MSRSTSDLLIQGCCVSYDMSLLHCNQRICEYLCYGTPLPARSIASQKQHTDGETRSRNFFIIEGAKLKLSVVIIHAAKLSPSFFPHFFSNYFRPLRLPWTELSLRISRLLLSSENASCICRVYLKMSQNVF